MSAASGSLSATLAPPATAQAFIDAPFTDSLWSALESLYASSYASRAVLASQCERTKVRAWTERSHGEISHVLLFVQDGAVVRVLNEVLSLSSGTIRRFAHAVFAQDAQIHLVQLHAVFLQREPDRPDEADEPCGYRSVFSEDYVLTLPESHEAWLQSLSRQAREKVRYHQRRAFRRQPGMSFFVTMGESIGEADVDVVLQLNHARMQRKGKTYGLSANEEAQLREQLRQNGVLYALRREGEICAGLLCSVTGGDVYMHVIAHDPRLDDLRPGLVCCCLAIRDAIGRRWSRFHFLWGHYDYKRRLGGRALPLSRVLVPRSGWHLCRHPWLAAAWLALALRDRIRRWRQPAIARERAC